MSIFSDNQIQKYGKLIWIPFFCMVSMAHGQNYQNICSEGVTFFRSYKLNLLGFRKDSIQLAPGSDTDTLIWSFPTIRNITGGATCYDTSFGSVLGRKILRRIDGTFVFFNKNNDSIYIHCNAKLNQTWKCITLSDGNYISATITGMIRDTLFGMADSVKIITLQAQSPMGKNATHLFTGKQIKLSKSLGFTQIYEIEKFPNDTTAYYFEGKTSPPIGYQDLSIYRCYDINVGDELHHDYITNYAWEDRIRKLLDKSVSVTGDTIIFVWEKCYKGNGMGGPTHGYDTVIQTIYLHTLNFFSNFNKQPYEFLPFMSSGVRTCHLFTHRINHFNQRSTKAFFEKRYKLTSCWVQQNHFTIIYCSDGLGLTKYYYGYWWQNWGGFWEWISHDETLSYFSKGDETWGTPHDFDCSDMVAVKTILPETPLSLQIIPNPVQTRAEIKVKGFRWYGASNFFLYDFMGREILRDTFESDTYVLERDHIPKGIYVVLIWDKSKTHVVSEKVVFE